MRLPTHDDVLAARDRIAPFLVRTPMLRNAALDARVGATVLIKPEPLQRTGSFKLRGATNAIRQLDPAQLRAGVVAHSSGNHGQAVACAAASVGARATVFMPQDAPAVKVGRHARLGRRHPPLRPRARRPRGDDRLVRRTDRGGAGAAV